MNSEFGESDEGWVNCTTVYYWHSALGGGIYSYEEEWYWNWMYYEPPEEEIVLEEVENVECVATKDPELPSSSTLSTTTSTSTSNITLITMTTEKVKIHTRPEKHSDKKNKSQSED